MLILVNSLFVSILELIENKIVPPLITYQLCAYVFCVNIYEPRERYRKAYSQL